MLHRNKPPPIYPIVIHRNRRLRDPPVWRGTHFRGDKVNETLILARAVQQPGRRRP